MTKNTLKFWDAYPSWEEADAAWEAEKKRVSQLCPLKAPTALPSTPPIAEKGLLLKGVRYLLSHDSRRLLRRYLLKHPVTYITRFVRSILRGSPYTREGDFFLYGFPSFSAFQQALSQKEGILVVGFAYCHKPFECPSGRFSSECKNALDSPVCRQCVIGKLLHTLPSEGLQILPLCITTVHHIGEELLQLKESHPNKKIIFLITACEMALSLFGHLGHMIAVPGVGVRLTGRVCNTLRAFVLSEQGIKPGLTLLSPPTQKTLLQLFRSLRST